MTLGAALFSGACCPGGLLITGFAVGDVAGLLPTVPPGELGFVTTFLFDCGGGGAFTDVVMGLLSPVRTVMVKGPKVSPLPGLRTVGCWVCKSNLWTSLPKI